MFGCERERKLRENRKGDDGCAGSVGTFVIHNHHMTSIYLDDIYRDTFQVLTK